MFFSFSDIQVAAKAGDTDAAEAAMEFASKLY